MPDHLLTLTVGPAHESLQAFIASARRCHDLWFGSWLVSELSKAAARGLAENLGPEGHTHLLFPAPSSLDDLAPASPLAVANKILALIPSTPDPADAARAATSAARTRLTELADAAFSLVGDGDPDRDTHFLEDAARKQIAELLETLWVAVPTTNETFLSARAQAERLLAARKQARSWRQPRDARNGAPKSSLDGLRESVLSEDLYEKPVIFSRQSQPIGASDRRKWYEVHGSERLCAVGLLKRFGRRTEWASGAAQRIPSTNHLAALPALAGIDRNEPRRNELKCAWKAYAGLLKQANVLSEFAGKAPAALRHDILHDADGGLLYPGRVREVVDDLGVDNRLAHALEEARRALVGAAEIGDPITYFAILVADGDSMGRLIGNLKTPEEQRDFSMALSRFARDARTIVDKHRGALIYAGGDDVLAFLPLHTALQAAAAIADAFPRTLERWQSPGHKPTLSAGLAVVHAWSPLEEGLDAAREAEKHAKRHPGKNALAVAVHKRSGAPVIVRETWASLSPKLDTLIHLHLQGDLPATMISELVALERLVEKLPKEDFDAARAVQRAEARRILARKSASEKTLAMLTGWLEGENALDPPALGQMIGVAQLFARARKQAGEGAQ
jgi:CRISPR-associated protein Cmr2